uniref:Uncharacterized protein n=1 Tax=Tanacetum cinerariifolium TaxID=118510 RepID=A0A699H057_TANCI|nr:hypothetical protein [Tanacetum cinerariifolium]
MYFVEHYARKGSSIRSLMGIGAGLGECLAPMELPDKIPIGDQSGFRVWFANRVRSLSAFFFTMSAKDSIAIQTCELLQEKLLSGTSFMLRMRKFLSFLPKEPSHGLGNGSLSVSVNKDPLIVDAEPSLKLAEDTVDSGGSSKPEKFRKISSSLSFLVAGLLDVFELKYANACHLKISSITPLAWKNHLDNHMDIDLLDLHDCCYANQDFLDNAVNSKSQELLQVIEKIRGECNAIKQKERAQEEKCEELRSKCEAPMTDFEKNPTVVAMREKMSALFIEAKEHKANLDRLLLENQKWAGYHVSLSALESKVASLEADKARLKAVEVSLKKEIYDVKRDKKEVVLKVIPYAPLELVRGDVLDPSSPIEVLLSKKPPALQRHVPLKTQVLVPSSQRTTPSSTLTFNLMSPSAAVSSVQPSLLKVNESHHVGDNLV